LRQLITLIEPLTFQVALALSLGDCRSISNCDKRPVGIASRSQGGRRRYWWSITI